MTAKGMSASIVLAGLAAAFWSNVAPSAEPPRGSADRNAILLALRVPAERDLGAPVIFKISRIDAIGGWAYVGAEPTRANGPIDWSKTRYAKAVAGDMMSTVICALMHREADGRWRVVEFALGPTDVVWVDWIAKYHVPRALFVSPEDDTSLNGEVTVPLETEPDQPPPSVLGPAQAAAPNAIGPQPPSGATDPEQAVDAGLDHSPPPPIASGAPAEAPHAPPVEPPPSLDTVGPWYPPPGNTGFEPLQAPGSPLVVDNGTDRAVRPGPRRPTTFVLGTDTFAEQVTTYHYAARTRPGTIALRHADGTLYGPWQAAGAVGQGNWPNSYWWVRPMIVLKAGAYTVIDSEPATWSHDPARNGPGIVQIWGRQP